jgi:hypothetical protein
MRSPTRRTATDDNQKSWIPAQDSSEPPLQYDEFLRELEEPQRCYGHLKILWNALRQMGDAVDDGTTEQQKLEQRLLKLEAELLEAKELAARSGWRNTVDSDTSRHGGKRSAKMPDPPALSDGVSPTFDSWLIKMKHKLRNNADHFDDEQARVAYVFSRTEGSATEHLEPKMNDENSQTLTAEEVLDYLKAIYVDPNREMNDRDDYRRLFMCKDDNFNDFYTKF